MVELKTNTHSSIKTGKTLDFFKNICTIKIEVILCEKMIKKKC